MRLSVTVTPLARKWRPVGLFYRTIMSKKTGKVIGIPEVSTRARNSSRLFQIPKDSSVLRTRKLGEVIAYSIKRDIAERGWPVGEVLGNQEELMQRYGVSRSTLREAVRQVERHGVARMRRGVNGGLVIQQPARDSVVLAIASYLELAAVSLSELFEAREVVEGLMIGLVCERSTDGDLRRLQGLLEDLTHAPLDDVEDDVLRQLALRSEMVALSRNGALLLLLEALYLVTSDMVTVSSRHPKARQLMLQSRNEKRELIEALVAGDEVAARVASRAAQISSREQAEQALRRARCDVGSGSALTLSVQRTSGVATAAMPKLGHRLSLRIANDIVSQKLKPGSHIGSEPALCERYGISRAVFREAVRTLELHDIVRVRRGLGGGLVTSQPNPAYTVELTSLYLQYARLKPRHFYEMWRTIQTAAAQLAARRIDPQGRERLREIIARQHEAKREDILSLHGELHEALSELSGNRVLALFTKVMSEIASYYPTEVPPDELWKVFIDSHRELVDAIASGEPALARRLMARHLKLVDAWYGEALRSGWLQNLGHNDEPDAPAATARKSAQKSAQKPAKKPARSTRAPAARAKPKKAKQVKA